MYELKAYPYSSIGVMRYNPNRKVDMKKQRGFQLVLNIDNEIRRYYHSWLQKMYGVKADIICPTLTTAHITIIKGNESLVNFRDAIAFLQSKEGSKCKFYYSPEIKQIQYIDVDTKTERSFFVLPVQCTEFDQIRQRVVIPSQQEYPFHITIGRKF